MVEAFLTTARGGRLEAGMFDVPPPEMEPGSEYDLSSDPRYAGITVPRTESLKLTIERVLPYWESTILPVLASGETVIISAHGNSLRALVKRGLVRRRATSDGIQYEVKSDK